MMRLKIQKNSKKFWWPFFTANKIVTTTNLQLFAKKKDGEGADPIPFNTDQFMNFNDSFKLFLASINVETNITEESDFQFSLGTKSEIEKLGELFFVLGYTLS